MICFAGLCGGSRFPAGERQRQHRYGDVKLDPAPVRLASVVTTAVRLRWLAAVRAVDGELRINHPPPPVQRYALACIRSAANSMASAVGSISWNESQRVHVPALNSNSAPSARNHVSAVRATLTVHDPQI
jgi:hypothetical protein